MWLHALTVAASIAVPDPNRPPAVVAIPFGDDVASEALSRAVEDAVPEAVRARGLSTVRADAVKPVLEALRRCRDDGCRARNTRRLGARYAVVATVDGNALALRLLDADVGDTVAATRIDGDPPAVLAQTTHAVDTLVDHVAPKAAHEKNNALNAARKARAAGDLDDADASFAQAIAASTSADDGETVSLWLERVRLYDAADRAREAATWDAFAAAMGPGTTAYAALKDVDRARVRTALHVALESRAAYDESEGRDYAAAAKLHQRIAALFPDEAGAQTLAAGKLLVNAGDPEGREVLQRLSRDESVDADARLQAIALLHE
jgi:hypothetical protein